MKLLAIAYPELASTDFERIQCYRKDHDTFFYSIVKPHFTLVFPSTKFSTENFCTEIKKYLTGISTFHFAIRCATVNKDAFNEHYHSFLVPDEGFSGLVKLHDQLYSGKLFSELRLDLDYIPHIGIGSSTDKIVCKKMTDEWNATDFEIRGKISSIDIVSYDNESVTTLEKIKLAEFA